MDEDDNWQSTVETLYLGEFLEVSRRLSITLLQNQERVLKALDDFSMEQSNLLTNIRVMLLGVSAVLALVAISTYTSIRALSADRNHHRSQTLDLARAAGDRFDALKREIDTRFDDIDDALENAVADLRTMRSQHIPAA
jgi:hypothetical protein